MFIIILPLIALALCFFRRKSEYYDIRKAIATLLITVDCVIIVASTLLWTNSFAEIAKLEQRYESIIYEIGQQDEFSYSLHNDIRNWNEDVAFGKKAERDFWFGTLRPNIYSNFDLIPYESNW